MAAIKSALIAIGLAALLAPATALAQPGAQALQQARQNYQAAVKTHNPQAIAQAHDALRAAYSDEAIDTQDAAMLKANPPAGESREDYLVLVRAKIDYREALQTHDKAEIARSHKALQAAYSHDWMIRHAKKSKV